MASTYTPTTVALNAPMGAIADGVLYERARIDTETARTTPLADLATLTAIAAPADGLPRNVVGFGWYVFKTTATTGLSPFRLAADDATPGGWVSSTAHETTKTVLVPCSCAVGVPSDGLGGVTPVALSTDIDFAPASPSEIVVSSRGLYMAIADLTVFWAFMVPLDAFLVDGATLASAVLAWRPVGGHVDLPVQQGGFIAIVRTALTGYAPTSDKLKSTTFGFAHSNAADVASYQTDRTVTFTPNQNNVIDRTLYSYSAIIFDEGGTNALAGNRYASISLNFTAIPDARRS